jgi:uncharacterized protein (TIGR02118 family)
MRFIQRLLDLIPTDIWRKEIKVAKLIVLYKKPGDPVKFDSHYFDKHVPLAKKLPGLRGYEVSKSEVMAPGGGSPYHLVATLMFDSVDAIRQALNSDEGKATAADLANFAQSGVEFLMFDSRTV